MQCPGVLIAMHKDQNCGVGGFTKELESDS